MNKKTYATAKQQAPDTLLLFRIGDFYELFFDDAIIAAKCLGLTITTQHKAKMKQADEMPMTGFPYHQLDAYLAKLVASGHRVAVCEQVKGRKENQ